MPLFAPIDLSQFNLLPEPPTFDPLWSQFFSDVDSMDAPLAALEAAQNGVDILGELGALEPIEAGISDALGAFPTDTGQGDITQIAGDGAMVDARVNAAQGAINAAGQLGAAIGISLPPISGISITPPQPGAPPSGEPPPPPLPPVGTGGLGGTTSFSLTLYNRTRPGAEALFAVGDQYLVRILGAPGANIYVNATQNNVAHGKAGMGTIGANGVLDVAGSMGQSDRGSWVEDWYHGTTLIREIAFRVG